MDEYSYEKTYRRINNMAKKLKFIPEYIDENMPLKDLLEKVDISCLFDISNDTIKTKHHYDFILKQTSSWKKSKFNCKPLVKDGANIPLPKSLRFTDDEINYIFEDDNKYTIFIKTVEIINSKINDYNKAIVSKIKSNISKKKERTTLKSWVISEYKKLREKVPDISISESARIIAKKHVDFVKNNPDDKAPKILAESTLVKNFSKWISEFKKYIY